MSVFSQINSREREYKESMAVVDANRPKNIDADGLMKLADAYAEASFDQGLNKRINDDAPEDARAALHAAISKATGAAWP